MSQNAWKKTKEALAHFRKLLLCSKCANIVHDPLCLGSCEHIFCRSCAGPCAGGECSVCSAPAWVKDIQINRQLCNITTLFRNLDELLNPPEMSATPPNDPCKLSLKIKTSPVVQKQKKYRIWTSPKSHRIRCRVDRPAQAGPLIPTEAFHTRPDRPNTSPDLPDVSSRPKASPDPPDHSVYNFPASSQDSGSSSPSRTKASASRRKKKSAQQRKKRQTDNYRVRRATEAAAAQLREKQKRLLQLQVLNQQWGVGADVDTDVDARAEEQQEDTEGRGDGIDKQGKRKRVSFQSPCGGPPSSEGSPNENAPPTENGATVSEPAISNMAPPAGLIITTTTTTKTLAPVPNSPSPPPPPPPPHRPRTPKRGRAPDRADHHQSTPKRPRRESASGARRLSAVQKEDIITLSTPPPSPFTSSSIASSSSSQRAGAATGGELDASPLASTNSSSQRSCSQRRQSPVSPAFMKKNKKGETPLHLASIKGEVASVKRLLEQGADPNLKDNAGWTPLHEACNHGHLAVVEALILGGALLNTPGYQNDSPLHDAVKNGRTAIVKLLLQHGASQSVVNMFGLCAVDCAETMEMRALLLGASQGAHPACSPLSPPASLSKIGGCRGQKDAGVTLLGTKLTQPQRRQLARAARLLGARLVDSFSSAVSHVVVQEEQEEEGGEEKGPVVPTTLSALRGILGGCWILRFSWVSACLQAGERAAEADHEAGEGPQRSRLNRSNLLPRLFDGCYFFLLGSFRRPEKAELLQLIQDGGGQVLSRQPKPDSDVTQTLSAAAYHAPPGSDQALCTQYVLYEALGAYRPARVRLGKVWSVPSSWLLDCISAFQLLPVPELESM
ncbi:BRCA1-associated RING domain protein 1 [Engraulis encrasicolus]|uniref:BRCA1-associated RING domain protein 1 n=1 Tax=Engraulis encrasicolus TaxID=184585 RepID=UPI002FD73B4E